MGAYVWPVYFICYIDWVLECRCKCQE